MSAPAQAAFRRHREPINNPPSGVGHCRSRLGFRFDKPCQAILVQGRGLGARRVFRHTSRPNCFGLGLTPIPPPADTI